jgi:large subunit ribosomal protein L22
MANDTIAEAPERPREHRENRKKNLGRKVAPNQAMAVAKFIRVPPRKARLVIDEVRGMYATDALAFLRFIPNRAAGYISKVLTSAVANAANNHNLNPDNLKLVEARVDEGPRIKRIRARAQGRAYRILKRMSHLTVVVQEVGPKPRKPRATAKPQTGNRAQAARAARQTAPAAPAPIAAAVTPEATSAVIAEETTTEETAATNVEPTAGEETTAPVTNETVTAVEETANASAETDAETK